MPGITSFFGAEGLKLTLSAPGVASKAIALSRFADAVGDFRPFWETEFRPLWKQWMLDTFRTQGANTGAVWAPLSPRYAEWKAKHGGGNQGILVMSGWLSASMIDPVAARGAGIWRPEKYSLQVGTNRAGAAAHQVGAPSRNLPQRPIIRPTPAFMTLTAKALQRYVSAAWAQTHREQSSYSGA